MSEVNIELRHSQEEVTQAFSILMEKDPSNTQILLDYVEDLTNIGNELKKSNDYYIQLVEIMLKKASEISHKQVDKKREYLKRLEKIKEAKKTLGDFAKKE